MSVNGNSGFEETDEELEGEEFDSISRTELRRRWESHQRDLLSHPIDFSVSSLVSLVERGDLDLNPEFERRDRWDLERQSRLIESLLLNIPVPPVFLSETDYGQYVVIDGRHRIGTLFNFVNDSLQLTGLGLLYEANGKKFSDLDRSMQRSLLSGTTVRAIVLRSLSDPSMKYEVFARLNTGGVPLNAQELRNAVYPGPFNRLTVELSEHPIFRELLGAGSASYSRLWREMRDVELVLRYFTLVSYPESIRGPMPYALSETLWRKNSSTPDQIERDRKDFISTIEKCQAAFGNLAFRRWRPEVNSISPQLSVALFDAEMAAVRDHDLREISRHTSKIQERVKRLFMQDEFLESLRFRTYAPRDFYVRVGHFKKVLEDVLSEQ